MKTLARMNSAPAPGFRCSTGNTIQAGGIRAMGLGILVSCVSLLWAGPGDPLPPVPAFDPALFGAAPYEISNPLLPLVPGSTKIFEGDTADGFERIVVSVNEARRVVLGIECRVVVDRAYLDGEMIEETYDWFAQDLAGNVWYFGEESREIEDGVVVGTHGSWEAGVDGARPGYLMLAAPKVGDRYRQEYYRNEAEDVAEVTALGVTVTLRNGGVYTNALQTLEWTPLEPGALENKYYVAGIGLVRVEKAGGREPIDWVGAALPLKEAKLNIEHNATDADTGFQGFIDSEGWQRLDLTGPSGQPLLTLEGLGELGQLGLTELFFETVEPENVEVPLKTILSTLPEGSHLISGPTIELGESAGPTSGMPLLTHVIPRGPVLVTPAEDATVDSFAPVVISWEPVTKTLEGDAVEIIAYELIIEKVEAPHPHMIGKRGLDAYLPHTVTRVELPGGFLEPDAEYAWEVLAIETGGNQTLTSGVFNTGDAPDIPETPVQDPPRLKAAKLNIEHNATDEDTGFQGYVDSEGWQTLTVTSPNGTPVLRFEGHGALGELGLTELFFETVEPPNAEVSIAEMLAKLPAGEYTFSGTSMRVGEEGGLTSGKAWLTHTIPAGPELRTPAPNTLVSRDELMMSWNPVTTTITGGPVNIIAYQLIIQEVQTPHPHRIGKIGLSLYLPPTVTNVVVPGGLLSPDTTYNWEVLAIEESGNQTLSTSVFATRPLPALALTLNADGILSFPAIPGHRYQIEMSLELGPDTEWSVVKQLLADGTQLTHAMGVVLSSERQAFIRVRQTPP